MFNVPNAPDTSYPDQAEPDAGDFAALGERSTGVISGCAVTAQGSPALFVDVASGAVVVNGTAVSVSSGSVAIAAGEATPRFDLVVVNGSGTKSVLRGTASTNPRFPTLDPSTYALLAAVYVRASVTSIQTADIIDKRVTVPATFTRSYSNSTTEAVALTDSSTGKTFKILSDGTVKWVSSILRRTADAATEFATSLTLKAADTSLAVLILKARASTPEAQNLIEVQPSGSTTPVATLSGTGVLSAANFQSGTGAPEGVVTAAKGTIYVDLSASSANTMLFIKTTATSNTGWQSFRSYSASESALPTGTIIPFIGDPTTSLPAGFVWCNGQTLSATAPANVALYALIGTTWGGNSGVNFAVPDLRGRSLLGAGGTVNASLGQLIGNSAGTVTLSVSNLPSHTHAVSDPGHRHPKPYFAYMWRMPSEPQALSPMPSTMRPSPAIPYMDIEQFGEFNYTASTGVTVGNTGSGDFITTLDPSGVVHWLVKL